MNSLHPTAELPLVIDSTMLTASRSCMKKFYWEFVLGLRPRALSIDLHAGGCFATAMEVLYRQLFAHGRSLDESLGIAHVAYATAWGDFKIPEHRTTTKTFERVWEAFEDYVRHYRPLEDYVQPYFIDRAIRRGSPTIEFTFAIPLDPGQEQFRDFPLHPSGDPFIYGGRADLLGRYHDRPVVRDEKTSGRLEANWADNWNLRGQFMGYVWAAQQLGLALDTVIVRGIIIRTRDIGQIEAIKQYPRELIARWFEQLRRDLWRIAEAWDEGYFDYNFGESCTTYGGCYAASLCQSARPENWFADFEVRRWNPLLRNPINELADYAAHIGEPKGESK
jgi:hypothetical protein